MINELVIEEEESFEKIYGKGVDVLMPSGIVRSQEKLVFARDILKDRVVRGSFEKKEYFSQKNVIVRDRNHKYKGLRQYFRRNGKAPAVLYIPEKNQEDAVESQEEAINNSEQDIIAEASQDVEDSNEKILEKPKVKKLTIKSLQLK